MRTAGDKRIELHEKVGEGGEGAVYSIKGDRSLVAKIYSNSIAPLQVEKLRAMVAARSERLAQLSAWPSDLIVDGGRVTGFVMPRVFDHREIHELYGPSSRMLRFPGAGYSFLLRAASNLARAVAAIHQHGHVIGDVNDKFALVSAQATVRLIDCDSFQICSGSRMYPCLVGVPNYQPPEVQRHGTYIGLNRTADHDNFGLAVLIFQILCLGRHPFAGKPITDTELPIEKAIREGRFAYSRTSRNLQVTRPPNTLSLRAFTPEVADLFELSFVAPSHARCRPTAAQWADALHRMEENLVACRRNSLHQHVRTQSDCPLCQIEDAVGRSLFVARDAATGQAQRADVASLWSAIMALPRPHTNTPSAPDDYHPAARPLPKDDRQPPWIPASILAVISAVLIVVHPAFVLGFAAAIALLALPPGPHPERSRRAIELQAALADYAAARSQWDSLDPIRPFNDELDRLRKLMDQLKALEKQEEQRIKALALAAHLEKFFVRHASISGIGPGLKSSLASFGIETAADVTRMSVMNVPGFGSFRADRLLEWRRQCEARFQLDLARAKALPSVANASRGFMDQRRRIVLELQSGPSKLQHILESRQKARSELDPGMRAMAMRVAQAKADSSI
jgi:DNA-binding helix-hairpin-helix protein with protein kinase domain